MANKKWIKFNKNAFVKFKNNTYIIAKNLLNSNKLE